MIQYNVSNTNLLQKIEIKNYLNIDICSSLIIF